MFSLLIKQVLIIAELARSRGFPFRGHLSRPSLRGQIRTFEVSVYHVDFFSAYIYYMNNLKFDLILIQIHEPGTDVIMRLLKPR